MKKTDKKPDKKKAGKKKITKNADVFAFDSKQLQKEFNKRMKVLVAEVKKDSQKTIKVLMKEAREKIQAGSEFIRNDVLKSIVTQYENLMEPDQPAEKPARKTRAKSANAGTQAAATTVQKKVPRQPKAAAPAKPAAATRGRKTAAPVMATDSTSQEQAA